MEKQTIKEAFGGEVAFTQFIARDAETHRRLLETIDMGMNDGFKIQPESHTVDNKRVDLVVYDEDGNAQAVIESQDATGWLDSVHASKIDYYMYDKNCFEGVLLTEDADEHIKGFLRWKNENSPVNIWLLNVLIFKTGTGRYIDFIPVMRPTSAKDKKVKRTSRESDANYRNALAEKWGPFLEEKFEEHDGVFTHKTLRYISRNGLGSKKINAGIHARKEGWSVQAYCGDNKVNDIFVDTFNKWAVDHDVTPSTNKTYGQVYAPDWDVAFELFTDLYQKIEAGEITT